MHVVVGVRCAAKRLSYAHTRLHVYGWSVSAVGVVVLVVAAVTVAATVTLPNATVMLT